MASWTANLIVYVLKNVNYEYLHIYLHWTSEITHGDRKYSNG